MTTAAARTMGPIVFGDMDQLALDDAYDQAENRQRMRPFLNNAKRWLPGALVSIPARPVTTTV